MNQDENDERGQEEGHGHDDDEPKEKFKMSGNDRK
jgi:hypothetical protein